MSLSLAIESKAISAIISTAPADGDTSPANLIRTRRLCASSLRSWRRAGNRARAQWFRGHIAWLGYPAKPDMTPEQHTRRQAAFVRRHWTKKGWPVPAWAQLA